MDNKPTKIEGDSLGYRAKVTKWIIRYKSKGFVLPRMTKAQRNAIATPVPGMAIYQTDLTPGLREYNGRSWMRFTETAD